MIGGDKEYEKETCTPRGGTNRQQWELFVDIPLKMTIIKEKQHED